MKVAVLFARTNSIYKTLPGCDVYDIDRDALTFPGGLPIVAHPPCRAWGKLRGLAKPRPGEKELAIWAVARIREEGGILEHPAYSTLWPTAGLPMPQEGYDQWGGYTIKVDQFWWGHRAKKTSFFYIVGCPAKALPPIPLRFDAITHTVCTPKNKAHTGMKELSRPAREHTPPLLAKWMVETAERCRRSPATRNPKQHLIQFS